MNAPIAYKRELAMWLSRRCSLIHHMILIIIFRTGGDFSVGVFLDVGVRVVVLGFSKPPETPCQIKDWSVRFGGGGGTCLFPYRFIRLASAIPAV